MSASIRRADGDGNGNGNDEAIHRDMQRRQYFPGQETRPLHQWSTRHVEGASDENLLSVEDVDDDHHGAFIDNDGRANNMRNDAMTASVSVNPTMTSSFASSAIRAAAGAAVVPTTPVSSVRTSIGLTSAAGAPLPSPSVLALTVQRRRNSANHRMNSSGSGSGGMSAHSRSWQGRDMDESNHSLDLESMVAATNISPKDQSLSETIVNTPNPRNSSISIRDRRLPPPETTRPDARLMSPPAVGWGKIANPTRSFSPSRQSTRQRPRLSLHEIMQEQEQEKLQRDAASAVASTRHGLDADELRMVELAQEEEMIRLALERSMTDFGAAAVALSSNMSVDSSLGGNGTSSQMQEKHSHSAMHHVTSPRTLATTSTPMSDKIRRDFQTDVERTEAFVQSPHTSARKNSNNSLARSSSPRRYASPQASTRRRMDRTMLGSKSSSVPSGMSDRPGQRGMRSPVKQRNHLTMVNSSGAGGGFVQGVPMAPPLASAASQPVIMPSLAKSPSQDTADSRSSRSSENSVWSMPTKVIHNETDDEATRRQKAFVELAKSHLSPTEAALIEKALRDGMRRNPESFPARAGNPVMPHPVAKIYENDHIASSHAPTAEVMTVSRLRDSSDEDASPEKNAPLRRHVARLASASSTSTTNSNSSAGSFTRRQLTEVSTLMQHNQMSSPQKSVAQSPFTPLNQSFFFTEGMSPQPAFRSPQAPRASTSMQPTSPRRSTYSSSPVRRRVQPQDQTKHQLQRVASMQDGPVSPQPQSLLEHPAYSRTSPLRRRDQSFGPSGAHRPENLYISSASLQPDPSTGDRVMPSVNGAHPSGDRTSLLSEYDLQGASAHLSREELELIEQALRGSSPDPVVSHGSVFQSRQYTSQNDPPLDNALLAPETRSPRSHAQSMSERQATNSYSPLPSPRRSVQHAAGLPGKDHNSRLSSESLPRLDVDEPAPPVSPMRRRNLSADYDFAGAMDHMAAEEFARIRKALQEANEEDQQRRPAPASYPRRSRAGARRTSSPQRTTKSSFRAVDNVGIDQSSQGKGPPCAKMPSSPYNRVRHADIIEGATVMTRVSPEPPRDRKSTLPQNSTSLAARFNLSGTNTRALEEEDSRLDLETLKESIDVIEANAHIAVAAARQPGESSLSEEELAEIERALRDEQKVSESGSGGEYFGSSNQRLSLVDFGECDRKPPAVASAPLVPTDDNIAIHPSLASHYDLSGANEHLTAEELLRIQQALGQEFQSDVGSTADGKDNYVSQEESEEIEKALREAEQEEEMRSIQLALQIILEDEKPGAGANSGVRQQQGNVRTMTRAEYEAERHGRVGAVRSFGPPILRHPLEEAEEEHAAAGFRINSTSRQQWTRRDQNSIVGPNNEIRTKHDTGVHGKTNAHRLGLDMESQDASTIVGNAAYNSFMQSVRKQKKGVDAHGSGRAGADVDSTKGGAMDSAVRLEISKAINAGWIQQCNGIVKEGKEAVVFHADGGEKSGGYDVAIKVFKRITEFRGRGDYVDGDPRYMGTSFRKHGNREQLHIWAEKEYRNLVRAYRAGVPVPNPLLHKENILFMRFMGVDGQPAHQLRELDIRRGSSRWDILYEQVKDAIKRLFQRARLVHGDLSEYNILVAPSSLVDNRIESSSPASRDFQIVVIDFGQAVDSRHSEARNLLVRDLERVQLFFSKQGVDTCSTDDMMDTIAEDTEISLNHSSSSHLVRDA